MRQTEVCAFFVHTTNSVFWQLMDKQIFLISSATTLNQSGASPQISQKRRAVNISVAVVVLLSQLKANTVLSLFDAIYHADAAEWLRRSVSNHARSTRVGSKPRRRNH